MSAERWVAEAGKAAILPASTASTASQARQTGQAL